MMLNQFKFKAPPHLYYSTAYCFLPLKPNESELVHPSALALSSMLLRLSASLSPRSSSLFLQVHGSFLSL